MTHSLERTTGRLRNRDGQELLYRSWVPSEPRGILLFVHGLAEHSARYEGPATHLASQGLACYCVDLRGHGESPGVRVHVESFDDYLSDVDALHRQAREDHGDLPLVMVGHSMGGLITLLYTLRRPDDLTGAILSSPGLAAHPDFEPSDLLKAAARFLSKTFPRLLIPSNLDATAISRDPEVVAAYLADPLIGGKVSARWYTSTLNAQAEVFRSAGQLRRPILLMHSGDDALTDPGASRRWASRAPAELVETQFWDGLFHEMFNEPEREKVFERMATWLEERFQASTA